MDPDRVARAFRWHAAPLRLLILHRLADPRCGGPAGARHRAQQDRAGEPVGADNRDRTDLRSWLSAPRHVDGALGQAGWPGKVVEIVHGPQPHPRTAQR